jgi:hypothetical protein
MTIIKAYIENTFVDVIPKIGYQIELSVKSPVSIFNDSVIYTCTGVTPWSPETPSLGHNNVSKYYLVPTEKHKSINTIDLIIDTVTKEILYINFTDNLSGKYTYGLVMDARRKNGPYDYHWLDEYRCPIDLSWKTIKK